ncbi:MAG: trypsin-like peptidase domain-containing protein [Clostridia bacterium]|nr:trypsin-like peptidase domain-containing protein [Clostridia bacterium]
MKKKFLSLLTVLALSFSLSACVITPSDNKVEGNISTYEVVVETSPVAPNYSSLVEMLDAVRPSVVEIYIQSEIAQGTGAGSGIILSRTGLETENSYADDYYFVLTCHHVIDGGDMYMVKDIEGNKYNASLIGGDPNSDIAVLRLYPSGDGYTEDKVKLSVATVRDINTVAPLKVGEDVVAIGNPLGTLGGTVTKGIISSVERTVNVGDIGNMNLIQTDCSINGGNSGGGLFDSQGNLVGVVNSGYTGAQGLNFAVPVDDALSVYESLTKTYFYQSSTVYNYGYVEGRARACAEYNYALSFGSEIAIADYSYNFHTYPVCVMAVKQGSVYAQAGFLAGDMIRSIEYKGQTYSVNLTSATRSADVVSFLNKLSLTVGDTVTFTVDRQGVTNALTVTYKQFIYGDTGYTLSE